MGDPSSLELYFTQGQGPGQILHNKMQKETKKVGNMSTVLLERAVVHTAHSQYWWRRGERWEVRLVKRGHFCASGKMRRVAE